MKERKKERVSRRQFFGSVGKGVAAGVGAALVVTTGEVEAVEEAPVSGGSYRETKHIKTYYRSARF